MFLDHPQQYNDIEMDPNKLRLMIPTFPLDEFPRLLVDELIREMLVFNANVILQIVR